MGYSAKNIILPKRFCSYNRNLITRIPGCNKKYIIIEGAMSFCLVPVW